MKLIALIPLLAALPVLAEPAPDAAPAKAEKQLIQLLFLDIRASEADAAEARVLQNVVASKLSEHAGIELTTSADLQRMVELETQKMAMDCSAESCLAEVAGALGFRYVLFGELGHLGNTVALTIALFDAEQAKPILRRTLRGQDSLAVEPELEPFVEDALVALGHKSQANPRDDKGAGMSSGFVTGAVVTGVAGAAAVGLGIVALAADASLDDATAAKPDRDFALFGGLTAVALAAAAVVATGAGVGLMVMAE